MTSKLPAPDPLQLLPVSPSHTDPYLTPPHPRLSANPAGSRWADLEDSDDDHRSPPKPAVPQVPYSPIDDDIISPPQPTRPPPPPGPAVSSPNSSPEYSTLVKSEAGGASARWGSRTGLIEDSDSEAEDGVLPHPKKIRSNTTGSSTGLTVPSAPPGKSSPSQQSPADLARDKSPKSSEIPGIHTY